MVFKEFSSMIMLRFVYKIKIVIIRLSLIKIKENKIDVIFLGSDYGNWGFPVKEISKDFNILVGGVGEDISFEIELLNLLKKDKNLGMITFFDPTTRSKNYMFEIQRALEKKSTRTSTYSKDGYQKIETYDFKLLESKQIKFNNQAIWINNDYIELWPPLDQRNVSYTILENDNGSQYFGCLDIISIFNSDETYDVLKLDVEGSETDILIRLLKYSRYFPRIILVEFDVLKKLNLKNFYKLNRLIMLLKQKNYKVYYEQGRNYGFILETN